MNATDIPIILLFPKLKKNALKGKRFAHNPDMQRHVTALLRGFPENDFQDLFPVVVPPPHEVHSFTRGVFQRQQQPLVNR
jgi:hypothetical protein